MNFFFCNRIILLLSYLCVKSELKELRNHKGAAVLLLHVGLTFSSVYNGRIYIYIIPSQFLNNSQSEHAQFSTVPLNLWLIMWKISSLYWLELSVQFWCLSKIDLEKSQKYSIFRNTSWPYHIHSRSAKTFSRKPFTILVISPYYIIFFYQVYL